MIKRCFAFFALSLLCAASVFGAGFALWSFTDETLSSKPVGVHITQSVVLGSFSLPEVKYVVLDGGTGAGVNPTITGVSFYKEEAGIAATDNTFTVKFKVKTAYKDKIDYDKVRFGIKIDVPEKLNGLIEHTAFYNERLKDGYIDLKALTIELTDHFNDTDFSKSDFVKDETAGEFTFFLTTTFLNRCFTYKQSTQPNTLGKYNGLNGNFAPLFKIELLQTYPEAVATE